MRATWMMLVGAVLLATTSASAAPDTFATTSLSGLQITSPDPSDTLGAANLSTWSTLPEGNCGSPPEGPPPGEGTGPHSDLSVEKLPDAMHDGPTTIHTGAVSNPLYTALGGGPLSGFALSQSDDGVLQTTAVVARLPRGDAMAPWGANLAGVRVEDQVGSVKVGANALATFDDASSQADQALGHTFSTTLAGLDASCQSGPWTAQSDLAESARTSDAPSLSSGQGTSLHLGLAYQQKGTHASVTWTQSSGFGLDGSSSPSGHLHASYATAVSTTTRVSAQFDSQQTATGAQQRTSVQVTDRLSPAATLTATFEQSSTSGTAPVSGQATSLTYQGAAWRAGAWSLRPTLGVSSQSDSLGGQHQDFHFGLDGTLSGGWTARLQVNSDGSSTPQAPGATQVRDGLTLQRGNLALEVLRSQCRGTSSSQDVVSGRLQWCQRF